MTLPQRTRRTAEKRNEGQLALRETLCELSALGSTELAEVCGSFSLAL